MNSLLVEFLLPSVIVTLLSVGVLTVILRNNPLHALLGVALMGWTVVLLLAEVSSRVGNAEGAVMALMLTCVIALQTMAGVFLVRRK